MTEEERLARAAIEKTLAICTQAGDARKADAYAESFAEDGVLILAEIYAGPEAIRNWMSAPSDTTANVRTYWLVITAAGLGHSGYFDDRFGKVAACRLIASRRPRTLWVSSNSQLHKATS